MQNLYNELINLLQEDQALIVDDKLNKGLIIDRALKLDPALIRLLLTHEKIKKQFFVDIDGIMVFDKIAFQRFVNTKKFLEDSYTQYKNKIGLSTDNENYLTDSKEVVLVWPHKDCILEGGQTKDDAKRNEIFYNTTLAPDEIDVLTAPKVLTNWKRYDKDGETVPTTISKQDNLIIKGNNLLALHTLKEKYRGQIKLIYIDPPYNPETNSNTFAYNNSFNKSTWLTFIKNRLEVAKQLLTLDGAIIIAIDENEFLELGILIKEIFDTYDLHCITIVHNPRGVQGTNFSYTNEYAFFVLPKGKKVTNTSEGNYFHFILKRSRIRYYLCGFVRRRDIDFTGREC
jgi:adenine-specific DNA-methyltransferase